MYWWWIVDIIHTCIHRYTTIEQVLWHWSSWFSIDITCSFVSVHQSNINHKHAAFIAHGYWSNMCWTLFIHYNSCDVRLLCKPMINALSNVYDAWLFDMCHYMPLHIIYDQLSLGLWPWPPTICSPNYMYIQGTVSHSEDSCLRLEVFVYDVWCRCIACMPMSCLINLWAAIGYLSTSMVCVHKSGCVYSMAGKWHSRPYLQYWF